jgi:sirohydrochlorin cobaltochelatase
MGTEGILICGHGSRHPDGVAGFFEMVEKIRRRHPTKTVEAGFLEFSQPSLASAVDKLYAGGVRNIVAVPAFLFTGIHLRQDLPLLLHQCMEERAGLEIRMASSIGVCDELVELACQRIAQAEAQAAEFDRGAALLFGIGVGASIPDANGDIAKLNQLICEKTGFGYALLGFASPVAKPTVAESARILSYLPHPIVVVLPLLIFSGAYLENSIMTLEKICREAGKTLVVGGPFQSDALILGAMEQRMAEVFAGKVDLLRDFNSENAWKGDSRHGRGV